MARRKLLKLLGSFYRPGRDVLARNCAVANLAMFNPRPWKPPEPKDRGLAPDPIRRDKWFRNLAPPR
jgi:hypothetical protein